MHKASLEIQLLLSGKISLVFLTICERNRIIYIGMVIFTPPLCNISDHMDSSSTKTFVNLKHANRDWETSRFLFSNPVLRMFLNFISFKREGVSRLAQALNPKSLVIDLGGGIGAYAQWLLQQKPCIVVVADLSFLALTRITPPRYGTIFRVCADLRQLPFKPDIFDGAMSIDALGHVVDLDAVLDEANRVCKSCARLFLHSECADYRSRWPDRTLIKTLGYDFGAQMDGHEGLMMSFQFRAICARKFYVLDFFSVAGYCGWFLGYPEKYFKAFKAAKWRGLYLPTRLLAFVKRTFLIGAGMRLVNAMTNRIEKLLRLSGGGSCFITARSVLRGPGQMPEEVSGLRLKKIDVIIATYGRPDFASALTVQLARQLLEGDTIQIVWQGSQKPPIAETKAIRLHALPRPNLPRARNIGLAQSKNEIVLFLDDDVVVHEGLLAAHRSGYCDSATGAIAGYIDDPLFDRTRNKPSSYNEQTGEIIQQFACEVAQPTISFMGAHFSVRRTAINLVGFFDERFTGNALWEEVDLAFRLRLDRWQIWFLPTARVRHLRNDVGGCRAHSHSRYLFHLFANTFYFGSKHAPLHRTMWLRFWKQRLEYLTRKKFLWMRHNPFWIAAGISGMIRGITMVQKTKRQK